MEGLSYIMIPSSIIGALCGLILRRNKRNIATSYVFAVALPWLGLLAVLMYESYAQAGKGGGHPMLLIVQLTAGTLAAVTGFVACAFVHAVRKMIS